MSYKKTPPVLFEIIKLFCDNNLGYLLFKCEHIFSGQNKNLDILFKTDEDYHKAARLLQDLGFIQRFSEKFEKYKQMYCCLIKGEMYSVHLHREISWHGLIALDKNMVFQRKKQINKFIAIPSLEDSILIHTAHILFENFKSTEREKIIFDSFKKNNIDKKYIFYQAAKNHWENGFKRIISNSADLTKNEILKLWLQKIIQEPFSQIYLIKRISSMVLKKIKPKNEGCLIALLGVNGSGKSTLAKKLLERCSDITRHLGKQQYYYYFGWKPTFPGTKIISSILRHRNKKIFESAINTTEYKWNWKTELLFIYHWWEFYYRYLREIRPKLIEGNLIISDRYIYDLFGQYPTAKKSLVIPILFKIFPSPTITFLLDATPEIIQQRKKTDNMLETVEEKDRTPFPLSYLKKQRENYWLLSSKLHFLIINTEKPMDTNLQEMINKSWRSLI